jgi:hypothetical protein
MGRLEYQICRCRNPEAHGDAFEYHTRPGTFRDHHSRHTTWEQFHNAVLDTAGKDCIMCDEFRELTPTVLAPMNAIRREEIEQRHDRRNQQGRQVRVNRKVGVLGVEESLAGSSVPNVGARRRGGERRDVWGRGGRW